MGRHRKPSTTGKTVAKVAVTGALVGTAGIAFSGTATAAPDSDWDRLAQCEAGGNWGINTGNGFQGGLQFSPSTWTGHGGGEFAATANQASREQQIVVAERVLESQGWGAWPSCSSKLGLSSAPTQRDAPAQSAPAPAPALPDLTSVPSTEQALQGLTDVVRTITDDPNVIEFVRSAAADPQVASFLAANQSLLPR
ncbi:transglycosylase family protein [Rhodococcoides corynebacterioides]|uniref:Transglycosylase family protein n=1 Tax=Rhodococcoides corynebacterioides TaxID=53972 RepID=A0ABS7P2F3_9NOCA|nr:transglycosylase family protein [Rhodococcus corynebacterioides]MBY6365361.1 transglycosylase family protein [Rhodococcus corynebacterioides]MBY6408172.1 transglycosylase family protein [Rhodococcus corynebacterioides]